MQRTAELKREKKFLEKTLNIKITIQGKKVTIDGDPLDEYEADLVLDAMSFGFPAKTAAILKNEDFAFRKINIKDYTRRKNLKEVLRRIIGTHGKTRKTLENISGSKIIIKDHEVGIIGPSEEIEYTITATANIIRGSKQTNTYKYLEKINRKRKREF